ncbi:hypothetical protein GZ78_18000 [Endozoicomonas numazuensis]|uniref:Uncharacterized protein n=1 Tax=Endozoicomonas numazuensis TaxID=1137799 RepID=A0A081NGP8_9GAMM|nr:hypothetical protein GZ78_18000 [Endozoicomonas numazuensis]
MNLQRETIHTQFSCSGLFRRAQDCSEELKAVQKSPRLFRRAQGCSEELRTVQKSSGLFRKAQGCSEELRRAQDCLEKLRAV